MRRIFTLISLICLLSWAPGTISAQGPIPQGKAIVIPDGTEISAVTTETISSKTAQEDDPITFKVEEDIVIDGEVVIAKGTLLKGVVSNAKKSGFFGKGGELNVRIESTETVDRQKLKYVRRRGKRATTKPAQQ